MAGLPPLMGDFLQEAPRKLVGKRPAPKKPPFLEGEDLALHVRPVFSNQLELLHQDNEEIKELLTLMLDKL